MLLWDEMIIDLAMAEPLEAKHAKSIYFLFAFKHYFERRRVPAEYITELVAIVVRRVKRSQIVIRQS